MSKPVVQGPVDGNIFAIMAAVSRAMKKEGQDPTEMQKRVTTSESYDEALSVCMEYADFDI